MLSDIVQIGDKIEIKQLDQRGIPIRSSQTYVSQLVDYIDDDTISIAAPINKGMIVLVHKGENYRLWFYTIKGLYECNCTIIQTYKENNIIIIQVKLTSDLKKIQRRQYFRLECVHEIEYRIITEEELELNDKLIQGLYRNTEERAEIRRRLSALKKSWTMAHITDLSGGGCKFNCGQEIRPGEKIRIKLDFIIKDQVRKLEISAEIIASQKLLDRSGVYEHRAEFYDISQNDREDLIKYIFEQERIRRKNDKIY